MPDGPAETATTIASDIRCLQCQYNLRGLTEDGLCPECGHPIATSLLLYTPQIQEQYRKWLTRIRSGALRLCIASAVGGAIPILGTFKNGRDMATVIGLPCAGAAIFLLYSGTIRLSAAEPVGQPLGLGKICRGAMIFALVAETVGLVITFGCDVTEFVLTGMAALQTAALAYCGAIAFRMKLRTSGWVCSVMAIVTGFMWTAACVCTADGMPVRLLWIGAMAVAAASLAAFSSAVPQYD